MCRCVGERGCGEKCRLRIERKVIDGVSARSSLLSLSLGSSSSVSPYYFSGENARKIREKMKVASGYFIYYIFFVSTSRKSK